MKKRAKAKPRKRSARVVKAQPHSRIEIVYRKKEFGKAPVEKHFVLHDGRKLDNLFQLVDELETMSEDAFRNYVTDWKNDFANWVRDVFEAPGLADDIQRVRNRIETQRAIMKHLLRGVAHLATKEHRQDVKRAVHKGKPVRCVIP